MILNGVRFIQVIIMRNKLKNYKLNLNLKNKNVLVETI